ncbi:MAG: hypothetical protein ACRDRU_29650 [Pseudonocardiaceae bacterium]
MDPLQAPRRECAGQPVEPLVDLVGGQFLELDRADERYHVPFSEDAVGRDGVRVAVLEPPGEPVADRVLHGVGVAGIDAGLEGVNGLPQLVRDGRFGPAPALDALAVAAAVEAEADRPDVPVVLRVDGGLVLADQERGH